jgi:hypothetical protein
MKDILIPEGRDCGRTWSAITTITQKSTTKSRIRGNDSLMRYSKKPGGIHHLGDSSQGVPAPVAALRRLSSVSCKVIYGIAYVRGCFLIRTWFILHDF